MKTWVENVDDADAADFRGWFLCSIFILVDPPESASSAFYSRNQNAE